MPKIIIDYSVKGTVGVELNDEDVKSLKVELKKYEDENVENDIVIEERFADEISQHIKYMATVEIEGWEIE